MGLSGLNGQIMRELRGPSSPRVSLNIFVVNHSLKVSWRLTISSFSWSVTFSPSLLLMKSVAKASE